MLEPWDWTEQDLLQLIVDQVGESLTLDYKESGALQRTDGKKNELSKDVSAFANAAGGVLVYGEVKGSDPFMYLYVDPFMLRLSFPLLPAST